MRYHGLTDWKPDSKLRRSVPDRGARKKSNIQKSYDNIKYYIYILVF